MLSREFAALRHGAQQCDPKSVEIVEGDDKSGPLSALLPSLRGVEVDQQDIAPIGYAALQISSFPTGPPSSHSRSLRFGARSVRLQRDSSCDRVYRGFFSGSITIRPRSTPTRTCDPA